MGYKVLKQGWRLIAILAIGFSSGCSGNEKIKGIDLDEVGYCEVLGRKLLFHLENGAVLESAGSLDDLAGQLMQYSNFFRPHRSFLVNMEYIQNISSRSIKMVNDAEIPIPHGKCSEIKNTYMEYAFNGEQAVL